MTENEYANLKSLGFSDLAIDQMEQEVFNENKDVILESQTEVTKYYEVKEQPQLNRSFSSSTSSTSEENSSYISTELSKEEYFKKVESKKKESQSSDGEFSTMASSDTASTSYRRLTTSIQRLSSGIRLYNKFIWDIMPSTRSYDVLSTSIDSTFSPKSGSQYGQQLWSYTNPNTGGFYGGSSSYSSSSSLWSKQGAGYGVKMNLKDNASNLRVTELEGYMYYTIVKNSSVTPYYINAYGNYSHAKTTVSSSYSYSMSVGGPSLSWQGVSSTSFDTITTHAQTRY
ncbi:hypothetical protein [Metabacillus niabensis]|uniref:hypothetical protein n=1 Tax=Metabacillus niabensis TaxID=324854 RepID=UPI001CFC2322|nr:hypothetical protein [Metabacillus niabensis]